MSEIIASETDFDGVKVVEDLNRLLRLRTTPIGMKLYSNRDEIEQIPRIRRPSDVHTTDQIVGQAARNGWTVGITADDLVGAHAVPSSVCTRVARSGFLASVCMASGTVQRKMQLPTKRPWMWCPSVNMKRWR